MRNKKEGGAGDSGVARAIAIDLLREEIAASKTKIARLEKVKKETHVESEELEEERSNLKRIAEALAGFDVYDDRDI